MKLVAAAGLGLGLGVVTGMPLGVVNVAIVDAAAASRRRFALGVALGGGIADAIHALLAFAGVGRVVTSRPELMRWLAIGAAVLIVGYAIVAWRRRPTVRPASDESRGVRGLAMGMLLTLPNPGALAAWVAVAASLAPRAEVAEAAVVAAGVGVGSAAWFALLAHGVSRVRPDHPALRIIPRAALLALVAIAIYGVVRAA